MSDINANFANHGTVEWIGLRSGRDQPINVVAEAQVTQEEGLVGDRFKGPPGADRQVTLIQHEHLQVVGRLLNQEDPIDPVLTRRNIVVSNLNLSALKGREFTIGEVVLKATGSCPPCSRMERNLGFGGYNAMRGHGGITATVVSGGVIRIGDQVQSQATGSS